MSSSEQQIPVVEVLDAGQGFTVVRLEDGQIVRREGTYAWRNNNPGNIEAGPFADRHGAIGGDAGGRFATFPTYEMGRAAKEALLFDTSSYRDLSIGEAIARYAPAFENDSAGYARQIAEAAGATVATPLADLSPDRRQQLLDAMERVEGYRVGVEIGGSSIRPATDSNDVTSAFDHPSIVSSPPSPVPRPEIVPALRASIPSSPIDDPTVTVPTDGRTLQGYLFGGSDVGNLHPDTVAMLDRIRQSPGVPDDIQITSGFRGDARNRVARGARGSQHLTGRAADIRISNMAPQQRDATLLAALRAGVTGIGADDGILHIDTRQGPRADWGYSLRPDGTRATTADPAPWVRDNPQYQNWVAGAQYFPDNPISRPSNAELTQAPRRDETTPRLSETYGAGPGAVAPPSTFNARPSYPSGLPAARSTGVPANAPQSTFPGRPAPVISGLPPASVPRLDAMRAQADQIIQDTAREPSGPFPISGPPASAPRRQEAKSPDQFQYQTRTRQVPNPAYRAPNAPGSPNQATPLTSYFSGMSGADYRSPAPAAPREPEFIPERYHVPVPGPVQGPQFGNVPNPMARPLGLPQTLGPVPRRRVGPVPSPIVPPNVPRRQGFGGQGFGGLGDWAQGFMAPRVADPVRHTMRQAPRVQQAGPPMQLTPPQMQPEQADQGGFLQSLLSTQPTNPSLNGRAQGPWNSTGGEGGFVW